MWVLIIGNNSQVQLSLFMTLRLTSTVYFLSFLIHGLPLGCWNSKCVVLYNYTLYCLLLGFYWVIATWCDPTDATLLIKLFINTMSSKKKGYLMIINGMKINTLMNIPYECEVCETRVSVSAKHCRWSL